MFSYHTTRNQTPSGETGPNTYLTYAPDMPALPREMLPGATSYDARSAYSRKHNIALHDCVGIKQQPGPLL